MMRMPPSRPLAHRLSRALSRNSVRSGLGLAAWCAFALVAAAQADFTQTQGPEPGWEFRLPDFGAPLRSEMALDPGSANLSARALEPSAFGLSGALKVSFVTPTDPMLSRLLSYPATTPGIYAVAEKLAGGDFSLIVIMPFAEKVRDRIGSYRLGYWPSEQGRTRSQAYENPEGFILVTRENQDTYVSKHFRLRDFLTHDQENVWPKALVLREELLDKLELVIADLEARGIQVRHMPVMSGFRTPQYNVQGVGSGGRAQDSRHQYGDAADVFVDNDRNGRMDDLNGDRRSNAADVRVLIAAVERVERAHPELAGGAGLYHSTSSHGPFVHIDARGHRARWGGA